MACFDALFLTSAILAFGLPRLSTGFSENLLFVQLMGPLFGCIHIFRTGVVYSTLAVTYERFQSVVRPLGEFRHKRYLITAIVVSSTLYNIPKFFEVTSQVICRLTSQHFYGYIFDSSFRSKVAICRSRCHS